MREHIVPRRLARLHGDPDDPRNLIWVVPSINGQKARLEQAMLKGDWLTVTSEFRRLAYDRDRTLAALRLYGLHFAVERMW